MTERKGKARKSEDEGKGERGWGRSVNRHFMYKSETSDKLPAFSCKPQHVAWPTVYRFLPVIIEGR